LKKKKFSDFLAKKIISFRFTVTNQKASRASAEKVPGRRGATAMKVP